MTFKRNFTTGILGLLLTTFCFGQTLGPTEYLGVVGPISFNKISYSLVWSAHPSETYYKQEYLSKDDSLKKFKRLILVEFIIGKSKLNEVVLTKIVELKKMKETNPVVNYQIFEKDGEVMLDFLVSQNTPDGKYLSIVERNVYRYKPVTDKNGQPGVLLLGVSERAYGDDIDKFFPDLKEHRFDLINLVGAYDLPEITVAK